MLTFRRTPAALLVAAAMMFLIGAFPARSTIYSADIEGRISLTEDQKPEVDRILRQSERDLDAILRKNGIDPDDNRPNALQLYNASGEMSALGQRTREQLSEILDEDQLRIYDRITTEVEERLRKSFAGPKRPDMSQVR